MDKHLDLSSLGMNELANRFRSIEIQGVEQLDLSDNGLRQIPPEIQELTSLRSLRLGRNRLVDIPDCPMVQGIEELDVSENPLQHWPRGFSQASNLRNLNLDLTYLVDIPIEIQALVKLQKLSMLGTPVRTIAKEIANLEDLFALDISWYHAIDLDDIEDGGRRLRSVPDTAIFSVPEMGSMAGLRHLQLRGLRLFHLPTLPPGLESLDVSDNLLSDLEQVRAVPTLKSLTADHNIVTSTSFVPDQNELTELSLRSNPLDSLDGLDRCRGLKTLRITNLAADPDRSPIWRLGDLRTLEIDANEVPKEAAFSQSLEALHLISNAATLDLAYLSNFANLRSLTIAGVPGQLQNLPNLKFEVLNVAATSFPTEIYGQTGLIELTIEGGTEDFPIVSEELRHLTQLRKLELSYAHCSDAIYHIFQMRNLECLSITWSHTGELPRGAIDLPVLKTLNLSGNGLNQLTDSIGSLASLEVLRAHSNNFQHLPDSIGLLSRLCVLDIAHNELIDLPESVWQCTNLEELEASRNQLVSLPEGIEAARRLRYIIAPSNALRDLPAGISALPRLRELQLNSNILGRFPESLRGCVVNALFLGDNRIREVPEWIDELSALDELVLYENSFKVFPVEIARNPGIVELYVQRSGIESIPDSMTWAGLAALSLQGNRLRQLPESLASAANLESLDVSDNDLSSLPGEWQTRQLIGLNLEANLLEDLPISLGALRSLYSINIAKNRLSAFPPELVSQGSDAVLEYLRERAASTAQEWTSKLLVVGEGGVGKTSLLRALRGETFRTDESTTHGIAIGALELQHPAMEDVVMRLSAWDFGGQEIYHASHQFYLTNRSLFIVAWNARLGFEQGRLYYWLDTIEALAPDSPIVLVSTWVDEREPDLPESQLRTKYPQIFATARVSNRTGEGIQDLRTLLEEASSQLPLMGEHWPEKWVNAANRLRHMEEKYVSAERAQSVLVSCGISPFGALVLLQWLHELGEILYFQEPPELRQVIVLKPQWLSEYVSRVLDSPRVIETNGIFTYEEMLRLWPDLEAPLRQHFLFMMERFDLSYRTFEDRDVSLVVERLPLDAPDYEEVWSRSLSKSGSTELKLIYELSSVPAGVPTWFIARAHRFTTRTHWRNGALLARQDRWEQNSTADQMALVEALPHERLLRLTVRGGNPESFFALLKDGIEVILARFPGLKIHRAIPCPGHGGESCNFSFDYEHLLLRYQRRKLTIECTASMEEVSVTRLLYGWDWSTSSEVLDRLGQLERVIGDGNDLVLSEVRNLGELTQRNFLDLWARNQAEIDSYCPSLFVLRPQHASGWRRVISSDGVVLQLYCQEPGFWHPAVDGGSYEIDNPALWIQKSAPLLRGIAKALKYAAPIVGPLLGVVDEALYKEELSNDIALMKELVTKLPTFEGVGQEDSAADSVGEVQDQPSGFIEGSALRAVQALLNEKDPISHWGGLRRVLTPEGRYLWLCDHHAGQYRN